MRKSIKALGLLLLLTSTAAFANDGFPTGPELAVTPGKLCDTPSKLRYPEQIPYCARDVKPLMKYEIIANYDHIFGYKIAEMPREDFKIDHLIPLCVGGSNDITNLWPQHKSVYAITDPLEPEICSKMYQGKLKQAEAVMLVIEAKTNLDRVKEIIKYVKSL